MNFTHLLYEVSKEIISFYDIFKVTGNDRSFNINCLFPNK